LVFLRKKDFIKMKNKTRRTCNNQNREEQRGDGRTAPKKEERKISNGQGREEDLRGKGRTIKRLSKGRGGMRLSLRREAKDRNVCAGPLGGAQERRPRSTDRNAGQKSGKRDGKTGTHGSMRIVQTTLLIPRRRGTRKEEQRKKRGKSVHLKKRETDLEARLRKSTAG